MVLRVALPQKLITLLVVHKYLEGFQKMLKNNLKDLFASFYLSHTLIIQSNCVIASPPVM